MIKKNDDKIVNTKKLQNKWNESYVPNIFLHSLQG